MYIISITTLNGLITKLEDGTLIQTLVTEDYDVLFTNFVDDTIAVTEEQMREVMDYVGENTFLKSQE